MMKELFHFLKLAIAVSLFSCEERRIEAPNIREKVDPFIKEIDSTELSTLHHWHFIYRGPNGFWQNDSIKENIYTVRFIQEENKKTLTTYKPERFIKDFYINVNYDTSMYNLTLIKTDNKILFYNNHDKLIKAVKSDLLKRRDPFQFFSSLVKIKNKYELVQITHYRNLREFIEFYFSTTDVLTYIPDSSNINPEFKELRIKDWNEGEWISKRWNLKKLKKPIEVGG